MENEKKIKVVLLEPGKLARAAEIDASLAGMQKTVGGLIEPFYPFEEQVCIVCNEESKINGMRPNRSVKNDDGVMVDFIFGPAFICDCRGENLDSLSDEQIDRYGKMFRYAKLLICCRKGWKYRRSKKCSITIKKQYIVSSVQCCRVLFICWYGVEKNLYYTRFG